MDDDTFAALVDAELDEGERQRCLAHIGGCSACRRHLGFMEATSEPAPAAAASEQPDRLGRYRVLEALGYGAMGLVYAAYDPRFERGVAIKCLRQRDGDEVEQARLLREARALARISHPNVVPVYDIGTHDHELYIVMERLVDAALEPGRSWSDRLRFAIQIGRGVAAAHAEGVVHRDLKPSNVMMRPNGEAVVTDFGLAFEPVATGARSDGPKDGQLGRLTETGAVVGTPRYMAPEQFDGGPADPRSDQFSYCTLVFELLYGRRPFDGKTMHELAQSVRSGRIAEVDRAGVPRRIHRALLRGLSPDPRQRWPTMAALVETLSASRVDRAGLVAFVGAAATALASAVAWAGAPSASSCDPDPTGWVRRWESTRAAELGEAFAVSGQRATWDRIRPRLDEVVSTWSDQRSRLCDATATDATFDARVECLARARADVDATLDLLADGQTDVIERAAATVDALADVVGCDDAVRLAAAKGAVQPTPDLVRSLSEVGAKLRAGRFADAQEQAQAVLVAADERGDAAARAEAQWRSGEALDGLGRADESVRALSEAVWSAEAVGRHDVAVAAASRLVMVHGARRRDHEQAAYWARHAQATLERIGNPAEDHARLVHAVGTADYVAGRLDSAERSLSEALRLRTQSGDANRLATAQTLNNLGAVALARGEFARARRRFERATEIRAALVGPEHPVIAESLANLGAVALRMSAYDDAVAYFEQAIAIQARSHGPDSPRVIATRDNLGLVHRFRGDYERAATEHREALVAATRGADGPTVALANLHSNLAADLLELGDSEGARRHYRTAIEMLHATLGPHVNLVVAHESLGIALSRLGEPTGALLELQRAQTLCASVCGDDAWQRAHVLRSLANGLRNTERLAEAETRAAASVALLEAQAEPPQTDLALSRVAWAAIQIRKGSPGLAIDPLRGAVADLETAQAEPRLVAAATWWLAQALWDAGQGPDEAVPLAQTALRTWESLRRPSPRIAQVRAWLARVGQVEVRGSSPRQHRRHG